MHTLESPQTTESRSDAHSSPHLWKILGLFALLAVAVAVILQVFVADHTPPLTTERLDEALGLWDQNGVSSYDMDITLGGAQPGNVHVEVRNDEVTAQTRNGRTPPEHTWYVWSVPGLFETLEQELTLAEDPENNMNAAPGTRLQLRCEFDPNFGYPARYLRLSTGGAPDIDWTVTRFQPH